MKVWKKEWDDIPEDMRKKIDEIVNDIVVSIVRTDFEIKKSEEIENYEHCARIMEFVDIYINEKIDQLLSIKPGLNRKKIFEQMKECQKFIRINC